MMFAVSDGGHPCIEKVATTREAPTPRGDPGTNSATTRRMPLHGAGISRSLAAVAGELARLVRLIAWVVAAIIVAGILLVVLKANPTNSVVSAVHDTAHTLIGPFGGMFKLHKARVGVAVNWGIAALVYLILGYLLARLIAMIGALAIRRRRTVNP
jgi:hypothetical protein